jgi:hypothetical protein
MKATIKVRNHWVLFALILAVTFGTLLHQHVPNTYAALGSGEDRR